MSPTSDEMSSVYSRILAAYGGKLKKIYLSILSIIINSREVTARK